MIPLPDRGWTFYDDVTSVYALAFDHQGSLWVTGYSRNANKRVVSRFDGQRWTVYTKKAGLASNRIHSIVVAPDGALWFGTKHGVSRFDGKGWTTYTEDDGLADDNVDLIVVAPDGALWFGTAHGASRFDGKKWSRYSHGDDGHVYSIAVAPGGAVWVSVDGFIARYSPQER